MLIPCRLRWRRSSVSRDLVIYLLLLMKGRFSATRLRRVVLGHDARDLGVHPVVGAATIQGGGVRAASAGDVSHHGASPSLKTDSGASIPSFTLPRPRI